MRDLLRYSLSTNPGRGRELLRRYRISQAKRANRPKYRVGNAELTVTEIAKRAGISYQAVQERIARNWPAHMLVMTPAQVRAYRTGALTTGSRLA